MNKMRIWLVAAWMLCLVLTLCACTQTPDDNAGGSTTVPNTTGSTETSSEATDDGKVTYTVHVVDEAGKPVTGGMIQFCLEACMPCVLDANGTASMDLEEADYKVSFTMMPAGYALVGEQTEFYFEEGSYEMTITLKAQG